MNEGSPSTLEMLVRKDGLTRDEWLSVIENLRRRFLPFMHGTTLPAIRDIRLPGAAKESKLNGHAIFIDYPQTFLEGHAKETIQPRKTLTLDIRGIFFLGDVMDQGDPDSWLLRGICGIDRDGKWMSGYVEVDNRADHSSCQYQKALSIKVVYKTGPEQILDDNYFFQGSMPLSYRKLWLMLVEAFAGIDDDRREKYEETHAVRCEIQNELMAMRHIPEKVVSVI